MNTRAEFLQRLRAAIGLPYRWGADGPTAYDCSGLVCGCLDVEDTTALGLFASMREREVPCVRRPGQLVFYGRDPQHITHVMASLLCWNHGYWVLVGARGGGRDTQTVHDAVEAHALVDVVVHQRYRYSEVCAVVDPWHEED
jgi:hypothetical protein